MMAKQTHPATMDGHRTINVLQAGRGLAALAVVVCHAELFVSNLHGPIAGRSILVQGYLGVDFFFVLSGFIIAYTSFHSSRSTTSYFVNRARRIYLPYWPIGIALAIAYTVAPHLSAGAQDWAWLPTLTLLPVDTRTALIPAWTLKHEILFYAVYGLARWSGKPILVLGLWGTAIIAAIFTGFDHHIVLAPINLEFIMGVTLALAYHRGWRLPFVWLLGLICFAVWVMLGEQKSLSPVVGLGIASLLLPAIRLEKIGKLSVPQALISLGTISYSLYLFHNPMMSVIVRFIPFGGWPSLLLLCALGSIGGMVYFLMIERPAMSFRVPRSFSHVHRRSQEESPRG